MRQRHSVYISERFFDVAKRSLDEELVRLKQDPQLR